MVSSVPACSVVTVLELAFARERTRRPAPPTLWGTSIFRSPVAGGCGELDEKDLNDLRGGALLHDISKLTIPNNILNKPGPLDDKEWEITKRHPRQAYELLSPIKNLAAALDIPRYHHERWDGSGYPGGLHGEQIPLSARIFAVVDVHDALLSPRLYRLAWTKQAARAYIQEQSGKLFDPLVAKVFFANHW